MLRTHATQTFARVVSCYDNRYPTEQKNALWYGKCSTLELYKANSKCALNRFATEKPCAK
jgi:hypothetical protein